MSVQNDIAKKSALLKAERKSKRTVAVLGTVLFIIVVFALMVPGFGLTRGKLVCGLEEHKHGSECYEQTLVCTQEEGESHKHNISCYEFELICDKPVHTHSDSCYEAIDDSSDEQNSDEGTKGADSPDENGANVDGEPGAKSDASDEPSSSSASADAASADSSSSDSSASADADMPEQAFDANLVDADDKVVLSVAIEAPKGALPADTVMKIKGVDTDPLHDKVAKAVKDAKGEAFEIKQMTAVDIVFEDADGNEVEPAEDVQVKIRASEVRDYKDPLLVHVLDKSKESSKGNKRDAEVVDKVKIVNWDEDDKSKGAEDTMKFKSRAFSPYVIVEAEEAEGDKVAVGTDTGTDADADANMPAQSFKDELKDAKGYATLTVSVEAPAGALPKDATMVIKPVKSKDVESAIEDAISEKADGKIANIQAVDISFRDADGNEIEPAKAITVTLASSVIEQADDPLVVHVDDKGKADVVDTLDAQELQEHGRMIVSDELVFDSDRFSIYAVVEVTIEANVLTSDGHNYKITVACGPEAGVPEGAKLQVEEIVESKGASGEVTEYEAYVEKTREALGVEAGGFGYSRFFDIKIVDEDGAKVDIAAPVDVKIELADKDSSKGAAENTQVVHFADADDKGNVVQDVIVDGNTLGFEAEGFSVYAIVDNPLVKTVGSVGELVPDQGFILSYDGNNYFTNDLNSNGCYIETQDVTSASTWYFKQSGSANQFKIYTIINDVKKYMYNTTGNEMGLTTNLDQATVFELSLTATGSKKFYFKKSDERKWLQHSGGGGGIRLYKDNNNKTNSQISITYANSLPGEDPYHLNGIPYTLLTWDGGKTGKAMTGDVNQSCSGNLCAEFLTVMTKKSDNDYLELFVPDKTSESVTPWTFTWQGSDLYKMSAVIYTRNAEGKQIEAGTQYLKVDNSGLSMVDSIEEASAIQVIPGTGIHEGQIVLKSGGNTLTYSGTFAQGFNINGGAGKEYLYLAESKKETELNEGYYRTYTATKISVSDPELTPSPPEAGYPDGVPKKIIIYTRVWNGSGYKYFAINGKGEMVPCVESGNEIEWIGSELDELQWEFTEYGTWNDGKLTPNYYYELYNPYEKKYLAPLISSNQILSDSKIGLNMNGRRNGQYYTSVLAWDEPNYSFASIKAELDAGEDAIIEPCYRMEGMDLYFATVNELDKDDTIHTVPTVDNNLYGITMSIANYNTKIQGDGCDTSDEQTKVLGNKKYDSTGQTSGLLSTDLDANGYPIATKTGISLAQLYTAKTSGGQADKVATVNKLFVESTYKATGYYEYDSAQNFAHLEDSGDFTVYQEIGTHDSTEKNSLKHGQFFPYNDIEAGHFASTNGRNTYTATVQPLDPKDPRYNEQLYLIDDPDYWFGTELTAGFYQTPSGLDAWGHDIIFEFSGDDDFWLYVDGELVIDLGGIHSALPGSVNFRTGKVMVNRQQTTLKDLFITNKVRRGDYPDEAAAEAALVYTPGEDDSPVGKTFIKKEVDGETRYTFLDNTQHTMRIFYMERGAGASNLHMKFNLASVETGTVQLSKELDVDDVDMLESVYATFPYQIWYKDPLYGTPGHEEEYLQLTEQALGNRGSVKYLGSDKEVTYKPEIYVDSISTNGVECSVKYEGVYLVDPGETIVIKFPEYGEDDNGNPIVVQEYKVVECGVDPRVYKEVKLSDGTVLNPVPVETSIKVTGWNDDGTPKIQPIPTVDSGLCNYEIVYDSPNNRSKVTYKNNVEETEELLIQKNLYKKEGNADPVLIPKSALYDENGDPIDSNNPDLKTTFAFRVYFKTPFDADYSPANVFEYYVKDPAGYYCKWVPANPEHEDPNDPLSIGHFERILVNDEGIKEYEDLINLGENDPDTLHHATFDTSINGSIAQIPAYYTVELRRLIPGTQFKVMERSDETPDGYKFYRYELDGVANNGEYDDYYKSYFVTGGITKSHDSEVLVDNYQGFGLHLEKVWADAATMASRHPAYFAVYYETVNDEGKPTRTLVDDSVRQLTYSAKPQELSWFYLTLPAITGIETPDFDKFVVREVELAGDSIVVDDDGVVRGYTGITVIENGGVIKIKGTANSEGAEEEEIKYKVAYDEPKKVGTNLRKFKTTNTPSEKPAVKFLKEDWSDHPLAGAQFTLEQGTTKIFENEASDADGQIYDPLHLSENTDYVIKETRAPQGYYGLQEQLTFQLIADEQLGWTLDVTPGTGDVTNYYEVGYETEEDAQGNVIVKCVTLTIKDRPYVFTAVKEDATSHNGLANVAFELCEWRTVGESGSWSDPIKWDDSPADTPTYLITDNNGVIPHLDSSLPAGTYQLQEKRSASGYAPIGEIDFTVNQMGVITLGTTHPDNVTLSGPAEGTGDQAGKLVYTMTIPNTPLPIKLKKVDSSNPAQPLKGAKFALTKYNTKNNKWESVNIGGSTSNVIDMTAVSEIDLDNLASGLYCLAETLAPSGYVLTGNIYFTIANDRQVTLTNEAGTGSSSNASAALTGSIKDGFVITVTNTPGEALPTTGGPGTAPLYAAGLLMIMVSVVMLIRRYARPRFVNLLMH